MIIVYGESIKHVYRNDHRLEELHCKWRCLNGLKLNFIKIVCIACGLLVMLLFVPIFPACVIGNFEKMPLLSYDDLFIFHFWIPYGSVSKLSEFLISYWLQFVTVLITTISEASVLCIITISKHVVEKQTR